MSMMDYKDPHEHDGLTDPHEHDGLTEILMNTVDKQRPL